MKRTGLDGKRHVSAWQSDGADAVTFVRLDPTSVLGLAGELRVAGNDRVRRASMSGAVAEVDRVSAGLHSAQVPLAVVPGVRPRAEVVAVGLVPKSAGRPGRLGLEHESSLCFGLYGRAGSAWRRLFRVRPLVGFLHRGPAGRLAGRRQLGGRVHGHAREGAVHE